MILARYVPTAEDRAVAIIEATKLESELEDAIKSKMVSLSDTQHGEIFTGEGALATFGAKIKIAYALGIFGKQTRKDLDTIRAIRNAFAHCRKPLYFHTEEVADACALLTAVARTPNLSNFKGIPRPIDTPRGMYIASTMLIFGALMRFRWPELFERDPESAPLD